MSAGTKASELRELGNEELLAKLREAKEETVPLIYGCSSTPTDVFPGEIVTVWDRRSMKTDLVTGRDVPDETKRVPAPDDLGLSAAGAASPSFASAHACRARSTCHAAAAVSTAAGTVRARSAVDLVVAFSSNQSIIAGAAIDE